MVFKKRKKDRLPYLSKFERYKEREILLIVTYAEMIGN